MTTIHEGFSQGKRPDIDEPEDAIVTSGAYLAVIDGETAKGTRDRAERSPGRIAADALSGAIAALDAKSDAEDALRQLSAAVAGGADGHGSGTPEHERPAAVVAIYSVHRREIWRVGDIAVFAGGRWDRPAKAIDTLLAQTRAVKLKLDILAGTDIATLRERDTGRAVIEPILREQWRFRNQPDPGPFSFGAIDGTCVPTSYLDVRPVAGGDTVVLASDGYLEPAETLEESEARLRARLSEDPLLIGDPPATKALAPGALSFDDRTYLRFTTT